MNDRSLNSQMKKPAKKSKSPVTGRQAAAAKRKERILEAAVACFLEHGYHQTGVRHIAKRAGVSLGNLYNHFPGKHDVLAEIAALERAELQPILKGLTKPAPAPEVFDEFLASYAGFLASADNVILTIEISSEAIRQPDIGELFLANRNELAMALTAVIERGVADGDFRNDLDPKQVALLIIDVVDGCAYRSVLSEIPMRDLLDDAKDFVFAAIRKG